MAKYRIQKGQNGLYTISGSLLSGRDLVHLATLEGIHPQDLFKAANQVAESVDVARQGLKAARSSTRIGGNIH